MIDVEVRRPSWVKPAKMDGDSLVANEWLVTNGLGGYASSTIGGLPPGSITLAVWGSCNFHWLRCQSQETLGVTR